MKVVAISDTHSHPLPKILEGYSGDLLAIAGDWSYKATFQEIANFQRDLIMVRSKFKYIVVVDGNHELGMEEYPHLRAEIAKQADVVYLTESGITLDGKHIWGSPATPYFGGWAFNYHRGPEIREVWKEIPENLDLLITHGPPFGVLDTLPWSGEQVGCEELISKVNSLENPPKNHIFGHIHCNYGGPVVKMTSSSKPTNFYNVAVCTEQYKPTNPPTEFVI